MWRKTSGKRCLSRISNSDKIHVVWNILVRALSLSVSRWQIQLSFLYGNEYFQYFPKKQKFSEISWSVWNHFSFQPPTIESNEQNKCWVFCMCVCVSIHFFFSNCNDFIHINITWKKIFICRFCNYLLVWWTIWSIFFNSIFVFEFGNGFFFSSSISSVF